MRNRMSKISVALVGALLLVSPVMGADYSSMTTEELSALRGTMRSVSQEEHAAFQQAWQDKLQQMTPEERQQYAGKPANAPQDGSGSQYGSKTRSGGGSGFGSGGGMGGNGGGRGGGR